MRRQSPRPATGDEDDAAPDAVFYQRHRAKPPGLPGLAAPLSDPGVKGSAEDLLCIPYKPYIQQDDFEVPMRIPMAVHHTGTPQPFLLPVHSSFCVPPSQQTSFRIRDQITFPFGRIPP